MSNVGGVGSVSSPDYFEPQPLPSCPAPSSGASAALGSDLFKGKAALDGVAGGNAEIGFGARGEGAKVIQQGLIRMGYLAGRDGGIYGRGTQGAVAAFQRDNGLSPSGTVDAATLAALDRKLQVGARKPSGAVDQSLLFVGMGDGAVAEAQSLKAKTAVTAVTDTKVNDEVTLKVGAETRTYKLSTKEGCDAYVKDLGLRGDKAAEVSKIILDAGEDARDEVAQIARAFTEAEGGRRNIERMVISGHSVGGGVWGDNNGYLALQSIGQLANAFPGAARQVEDFMVAGCYSGGESAMERFRAYFPNLKTSWAYTGSAPGSWSGAMTHLDRWERGTRGHDPAALSRNLAAGTRKGENVAVWTAAKGYDDGQPMRPIGDLKREYERQRPDFERFLTGERAVEDTQSGPVREYYNSIQRLLQHPQLPAADRPALEAARDQVIRLNFYEASIRGRFQTAHATKIAAGFEAVGLTPPDFSKLSRKEALDKVREFEAKLGRTNPKPEAALALRPLLTDGLRDLDPSRIPNTWV